MVTIKDVAKRAQVSITTVSRVLNETEHAVSPETRKKVLEAIEELGFIPNAMARGLHRNKTKAIGLIIQDISNPYYPSIVRGVEDEAQELGYSVILANVYRSKERTTKYLNVFREKRVDGIIFTGGGVVKDVVEEKFFEQTSISTVVIGKPCTVRVPSVQINNVQSSREACEYLLKLGHRHIVTITGPEESTTAIDRLEGYRQALISYGIEPQKELIIQGNFEFASGYRAIKEFLEIGKGKVTAIFAQNDMMAIGAMKAIKHAGYKIPDDIAVAGFDDIEFSSLVEPALTTVFINKAAIGKTAVEKLKKMIDKQPVDELVIEHKTKLVIREST